MENISIRQSDFERILRDACEHPFGEDVVSVGAPDPTEKDYLFAIWRNITKHIKMESPALLPANGRTDIQLLRDEIDRLVMGHQLESFPIHAMLYEHVNGALRKSTAS